MRGRSGWTGSKCPSVTLSDLRGTNLGRLLLDFSRSGLCIVLGAGASHGVIPISKDAITAAVREHREAKGNLEKLPQSMQDILTDPALQWVMDQVPAQGERFLDEAMPWIERSIRRQRAAAVSPGVSSSIILNEVFTPRGEVPSELSDIYDVLESHNGTLIPYNYDRVEGRRSLFRVIAPHGQRSEFSEPAIWHDVVRIAYQSGRLIPTDLHPPVPEHEGVRDRPAYQQMLHAWALANAIVLVGYGFGGGDDALSFEDFGRVVRPTTAVHVVNPDTREVCKQVGYPLRWRGRSGRIVGHNFKWRELAAAILAVLDRLRATHVFHAIGHEQEICDLHNRGCAPRAARRASSPQRDCLSRPLEYRRHAERTAWQERVTESEAEDDIRYYHLRLLAAEARRRAEMNE